MYSSARVFTNIITPQNLIFPTKTITNYLQISSVSIISNPIGSKRSWFSTRFCSNNKTPVLGLRSVQSMATQSKQSVYDFSVKDAKGQEVNLSKFRGKVLLIVNVASQCGFTNSNYPELTTLYQRYKDQGLEILAFPSNQFNGQEPGSNEEIQEFVCTRFKAEYPVFGKVDVNGKASDPLYTFLRSSKGGLLGDSIKWNFTKFLVDSEGKVVDRYAPTTTPLSIEKDIKKLLGVA
ncbi:probable phospholipid hydroperoxide glutathione peroxidase [Rutidosis leptorrhynchoides]|uniref:probable phospholipid hydroperoxide glutathione peroxidase n=1 Tax=Rutidosis leptorrhynchoides TaxID=125765 RepID=UPI003A98F36E